MAVECPKPFELTGTVEAELRDINGRDPHTIIKATDAFQVKSTLRLAGSAVPFLGGKFEVTAYAEDLTGGYEGKLGDMKEVPLTGGPELVAEIAVPAMGEKGAYKLIVLWLYKNVAGEAGEMAAFAEGPIFQIY